MSRFAIFSLARCGSTTLMRVLNHFPGVKCINEPFNPDNFEGKFRGLVVDSATLSSTVGRLLNGAAGIKHVWHPSGWPFDTPALNKHLLYGCDMRVLFLRRRNILRRVVSSLISQQLGEWSFARYKDRTRLRCFKFEPLDQSVIVWHLANETILTERIKECIPFEKRGVLHDLWYEDLYDAEATLSTRLTVLFQAAQHIGLHADISVETQQRICRELDPSNRVNSEETYARIPGIGEIERRFGSNETGWLFKK